MEHTRARILVVDDTKENIDVLVGILQNDYEISVAMSGAKAIKLALKVKPDLILLDVQMPEMDGYQTLEQLRNYEEAKDIPVFFITANKDRDHERIGLDLGAVDYIGKPIAPELVKLRIKNQLEYKFLRDHLNESVKERTKELETKNAQLQEKTAELQEKSKDLRETMKVLLTSLGRLAEYRDPETGFHLQRTQLIVQKLAQELQNHPYFSQFIKSREYIDYYATAAPLHDIGKVGITDDILRKNGALDSEERKTMMEHARMGHDVLLWATDQLKDNPMVRIAADMAFSHHERWDGTGYPRRLSKESIPVGARMMAVADVYDALVTKRPYKAPWPHEKAVEEIVKGRGSQFDPDVVDAFMKIQSELPKIYEQFKDGES